MTAVLPARIAPLHIALVGSFRPGSLERSIQRGFESLGHRVSAVPYAEWTPALSVERLRGAGLVNRALATVSRPALELRLVFSLRELAPDLVLILKCDDLHRATYRALRATLPRTPLVAFHPDDPYNRPRGLLPGPANPRADVQIREVDTFFVWSHPLVAKAQATGARRAAYLPFACDPELHPRVTDLSAAEREALGSPICFIGNWDPEREAWLTPLAEAELGLAVWGAEYWRTRCKSPALRRAYRGRPLTGREQAAAAAASDILVNVLRRQNKGACNMRTFEIPCTGGFMLHERSPDAAAFFPPDLACGDFASPEDLVTACRRWLADPERRREVAAEGHRRALAWTYREWAAALLTELARPAP